MSTKSSNTNNKGMSRRRAMKSFGAMIGAAAVGSMEHTGQLSQAYANSGWSGNEEWARAPHELLSGVEHIIVLCMENRSFDHYYGALQVEEGRTDVNGLDGSETNPDVAGNPVGVFKMDNFRPEDPPHSWNDAHAQWNNGANDRFVIEHELANGSGIKHEVMGYHNRVQLPVLYQLADEYTLCDNWFSSVLGPTWPNRYYLHCASSGGRQGNSAGWPPYPRSIQDVCSDAGISNRNYYDGLVAWRWGGFPFSGFSRTSHINRFFDALDRGTLEQVVIIDPDYLYNDDHPAHDIQRGQILIGSIYQALANSHYWDTSLLIITYDEHGGFHDHVSPPTTEDDRSEFSQLGFRVPAVVVGPHVRRGFVNHTVFEHASFPATITRKFGFSEHNTRAAAANDLSSCIDPNLVAKPRSPMQLRGFTASRASLMHDIGMVTSQEELFANLGIAVPLDRKHMREEQRSVEDMLARAERFGLISIK